MGLGQDSTMTVPRPDSPISTKKTQRCTAGFENRSSNYSSSLVRDANCTIAQRAALHYSMLPSYTFAKLDLQIMNLHVFRESVR